MKKTPEIVDMASKSNVGKKSKSITRGERKNAFGIKSIKAVIN